MKIAILSAMEEECLSLIYQMQDKQEICIGSRTYYEGVLWGKDVVVVFSRWGKVAAASTTVILIREFKVTEVIFTGVAGAIDRRLNIGDVVIGDRIYQHDIDARPMLAQYEIPLLGIKDISSDRIRQTQLFDAATEYVNTQLENTVEKSCISEFKLHSPKVLLAGVATGDQFITCEKQAATIKQNLPDVACVEMEGGAVAQVCNEYDMTFSIIRTISDSANSDSSIDFQRFVTDVASVYSLGIVKNVFNVLS